MMVITNKWQLYIVYDVKRWVIRYRKYDKHTSYRFGPFFLRIDSDK